MARGDLDFKNGTAHIVGTYPSVPDLAGEIVIAGGNAYTRAPGQTVYTVTAATNVVNPTDRTSGPVFVADGILALAADPILNPQLVGTEDRPGGTCYHVRVQTTSGTIATDLRMTGVGVSDAIIDLWIYESDFTVQAVEIHVSDPSAGSSAIRLVMSNYNAVSPIDVPPPAQLPSAVPVPAAT